MGLNQDVGSVGSYVVETVQEIASVGLGYFYFRDVVERRKQYAVVAVDDADISDVDYKLLVGAHEVGSIAEYGLCGGLAFEDDAFEVVEDAFPYLSVRHIAEVDDVGRVDYHFRISDRSD